MKAWAACIIAFQPSTLSQAAVVLLALATAARATIGTGGTLPDRSALNSTLAGYGPVTEDFETLPLANVGQVIPPVLNSTVSVYGFGSGLVVPGVTFRDALSGNLQWNGVGYYGQPSGDLDSNSGIIEIDFLAPAGAIGLDLLVYAGFSDIANVNVYAADNVTLLASISGISINDP